jgi:hypothetical protein
MPGPTKPRPLLAALGLFLAAAAPAHAQSALRVVGVAPNDVLNVRELPSAGARIVGIIPPDGRGVVPNGERVGNWIFVRHRRVEGWVDRRYVAPEAPAIRRGRSLPDDMTE